jgi:hypothetical protein
MDDFVMISDISDIDIYSAETFNIAIPYQAYFTDLLNSFKDNDDIKQQFLVDVPRTTVYLNGGQIDDSKRLYDILNQKYTSDKTLLKNLLAVCTQASLGLIIESLHNKLIDKNVFIMDISRKWNQKYKVKINTDQDELTIQILKNMRLVRFLEDRQKTDRIITLNIQISMKPKEDIFILIKSRRVKKGLKKQINKQIYNINTCLKSYLPQ